MDTRSKFLKIYANLPLNERDRVIVIIDGQPLTWNAAWLEVDKNTLKGKEILEKLTQMKILI
ncbi:hypothetical protein HYW46_02680 [Candidatus Daviesbacteria bacterium]|nr:hypothetical protein [Candidatus Daviesbacteria bacterium]